MLIGQQIGPFHIEKELGSGAMGTVYFARFHNKDKVIPVALKVVSLGLLGNESAMARFDRESAILKQLKHPHIVRLLATGRYRQTPFIAMEFVDGEPLDRVLSRRGRLGWEEVMAYGKQLCEALQHAHDKGIIHRDLKPSNLMITREGILKLTDFGIAKDTDVTALTGMNSTIGTAAYMSPEQCRGQRDLSAKSDLYSLGVVFYELITGRKPFQAETTMDMFLKHANEPPIRPTRFVADLPIWVDNLIMFLMEKKAESRPLDALTVKKMIEDIEQKVQAQQSLGVEAANARRIDRPVSDQVMDEADREAARALKGEKPRKKKKKKKAVPFFQRTWVKALGIGAVLLFLAGTGVWLALPEGVEKAYQRVESAKPDEKLEAATQFLASHGTKTEERVEKVRAIFRELRAKQEEAVLARRHRNKMTKPEDGYDREAYENIMAALDSEATGNLRRASDCWVSVRDRIPALDHAKYTDDEHVRKGAWRWVAEKRLADITAVADSLRRLKAKIEAEQIDESPRSYEPTDPEGLAARAVRLQAFGDPIKSRGVWDTLANQTEKDLDKLRWYMMATEQRALIPIDTGKEDQTRSARLANLKARLDAATTTWDAVKADPEARVKQREVRIACREVIALYLDDNTKDIQAQVERARQLLKAAEAK
jgi:serine/threonine-protein kinase